MTTSTPAFDMLKETNKTAPESVAPLIRGLATETLGDTVTDNNLTAGPPEPATLTERLLWVRSIAGHITPTTTADEARIAYQRITRILNGGDA